MGRERRTCELCHGRLYSDESQIAHELSGRCLERNREPSAETVSPRRFQSDFSIAATTPGPRGPSIVVRNPRSWGAGAKKGTVYRSKEPAHGTRSRRTSKKWGPCDCDLCREADNTYARERRLAKAQATAQSVAR